MKEIQITDDLIITEKTFVRFLDNRYRNVFEYYIGDRYIFGALEPFDKEHLTDLYNNGYFKEFI